MQYSTLPKTNLKLSQISLGTMMFGGQTSEADSLAIMDYAFDHGVNCFDTANIYNQGESERIVGRWLQGHLAGKHKPGQPAANTRFANNQMYYNRYWSDENFRAVDRLKVLAQNHGITILELAMRWCAAQPIVTSVISGVSRLEQIVQNISVLEGDKLSPDVFAECDEVWRSLAGARFAYYR